MPVGAAGGGGVKLWSLLTGEDEPERSVHYPFRRMYFAGRYLAACFALAVGEALGFYCSPASACWPFAVGFAVMFVALGFGWRIPGWGYLALTLVGFALALYFEAGRAGVFDRCDYSSDPLTGDFKVEGKVTVAEDHIGFNSSDSGVTIRVLIKGKDLEVPKVGEVWRCSGWLTWKPREDRQRRMLWVCGRGASAVKLREASRSSWEGRLRQLRKRLSENAGYGLEHDPFAVGLNRAILLGERERMSPDTLAMFADAGTVHVFAISGLHVGVVARMIVALLMMVSFFPYRWVVLILAPVLAAYVMMIGSPPSAVRAAVMSVAYYAAPLFLRRSDSLVAWAVTFLGFHLIDPSMLVNVGSLLSFTVMLGILLYLRWAEAFQSAVLTGCGVCVSAWASGVPITAHVFSSITFGGLLANLLLIPVASVGVVVGFLGALTAGCCPWLGSHLNNAAALLTELMTGVSWVVARLPGASMMVEPWPMWMCFAWYVMIGLALWFIRSVHRHRRERL